MKYIVREVGKSGGREFVNPDDAIEAAAEWEVETGVLCEIYMTWLMAVIDVRGHVCREVLSVPHTSEARQLAASYRWYDMSELEKRFDLIC